MNLTVKTWALSSVNYSYKLPIYLFHSVHVSKTNFTDIIDIFQSTKKHLKKLKMCIFFAYNAFLIQKLSYTKKSDYINHRE